jgi:hypothetical protein
VHGGRSNGHRARETQARVGSRARGYVQSKSTDRERINSRGARARLRVRCERGGWAAVTAQVRGKTARIGAARGARQVSGVKTAPRARAKEPTRRGGTRGCDVVRRREEEVRCSGSSKSSSLSALWLLCLTL